MSEERPAARIWAKSTAMEGDTLKFASSDAARANWRGYREYVLAEVTAEMAQAAYDAWRDFWFTHSEAGRGTDQADVVAAMREAILAALSARR